VDQVWLLPPSVHDFVPQLDVTKAALRRKPREISADAASAANLTWKRWRRAASRATWRQAGEPRRRRSEWPAADQAWLADGCDPAKLKRAGRSRSRLRQQTVEPVIGQIKQERASSASFSGAESSRSRPGGRSSAPPTAYTKLVAARTA
jgi:hypothetical protein